MPAIGQMSSTFIEYPQEIFGEVVRGRFRANNQGPLGPQGIPGSTELCGPHKTRHPDFISKRIILFVSEIVPQIENIDCSNGGIIDVK